MKDLLQKRAWIVTEFAALFFGIPAFFFFHATRWNVHVTLWAVSLCVLLLLRRTKDFSWRKLWHGTGWPKAQKKMAILRFAVATPLIILLTLYLVPYRLLSFPMQRPWFWLLVMGLYPILSVVPQELVFRSFFFRRYRVLFPNEGALIAASAFVFGLIHVIFHNPVSPTLSFIGGLIFATSYREHRSLKWATIEHAAYGCMVFTAGIGFYFLVGGIKL